MLVVEDNLIGTRLWDQMKSEDRIALDTFPEDWKYHTLTFPVARYKNLSYESPLKAISFISFFEKKFKPISACSGYSIVFSLFLPGHYIPAAFFNKFSPLP